MIVPTLLVGGIMVLNLNPLDADAKLAVAAMFATWRRRAYVPAGLRGSFMRFSPDVGRVRAARPSATLGYEEGPERLFDFSANFA
jgi:hypothetical protein